MNEDGYPMNPELAKFIARFMRFEYAMKQTDAFSKNAVPIGGSQAFVNKRKRGKKLEPGNTKFANGTANGEALAGHTDKWGLYVREADWCKLSKELKLSDPGLLDRLEAGEGTKILWSNPPNRLVTLTLDGTGQTLKRKWFITRADNVADKLFEPVKWLRNIVAHGESPGLEGRPLELVKAASAVLAEAERVARGAGDGDLKTFAENLELRDDLAGL